MNKVKKSIAALQTYLGQDSRGIAMLADISKAATFQRQEIASLREKTGLLDASLAMKLADMREQESMLTMLRTEIAHTRSLLVQRERDLRNSEKEIIRLSSIIAEHATPDVDVPKNNGESIWTGDMAIFAILFNDLKREMQHAPGPVKIDHQLREQIESRDRVMAYELSHVCKSHSPSQMMKLGRFVAYMAMMRMPVVIAATQNIFGKFTTMSDEQQRRHFQWFSKNNVRIRPLEQLTDKEINVRLNSRPAWIR